MAEKDKPITYITKHTVIHGEPGQGDPIEYPPGSEFSHPDEAVIKALRRSGALALPNELQTAEETARRMAEMEAEMARIRAENERLREQALQDRAAALKEDAEAEAAKKTTPKKGAAAQ